MADSEWRAAFDMAAAALAAKSGVTELLVDECAALRRALAASATAAAASGGGGYHHGQPGPGLLPDDQPRAQAQDAEAAAAAAGRECTSLRGEVAHLQHELQDASEAAHELIDVVHHLHHDDTDGSNPSSSLMSRRSSLSGDGGGAEFEDVQADGSSPPPDLAHRSSWSDTGTPPPATRGSAPVAPTATPASMRATPQQGPFTPLERRLNGMTRRLQEMLHARDSAGGAAQHDADKQQECAGWQAAHLRKQGALTSHAAALQDASPARDAGGARLQDGS